MFVCAPDFKGTLQEQCCWVSNDRAPLRADIDTVYLYNTHHVPTQFFSHLCCFSTNWMDRLGLQTSGPKQHRLRWSSPLFWRDGLIAPDKPPVHSGLLGLNPLCWVFSGKDLLEFCRPALTDSLKPKTCFACVVLSAWGLLLGRREIAHIYHIYKHIYIYIMYCICIFIYRKVYRSWGLFGLSFTTNIFSLLGHSEATGHRGGLLKPAATSVRLKRQLPAHQDVRALHCWELEVANHRPRLTTRSGLWVARHLSWRHRRADFEAWIEYLAFYPPRQFMFGNVFHGASV